jgi:hypothetical protein
MEVELMIFKGSLVEWGMLRMRACATQRFRRLYCPEPSPCTTSRFLRPDLTLPQTEGPDILVDEGISVESCRECMH